MFELQLNIDLRPILKKKLKVYSFYQGWENSGTGYLTMMRLQESIRSEL